MSAVELGFFVQIGNLGAALCESNQQLFANVGVRHLTTAKANRDLHAITVRKELARAAHLGVEVVGVNAGRHTNLLDLHHALILSGFLFPLELVKTELAVIHDLADRGDCIRRDLYEIKLQFLRHCQRCFGGNDTDHSAVRADESNFLIPNFLVELMI